MVRNSKIIVFAALLLMLGFVLINIAGVIRQLDDDEKRSEMKRRKLKRDSDSFGTFYNFTNSTEESELLSRAYSCDQIDVALVCAGYNSTRSTATLIKSILFHRKNPIKFHFMVDDPAHKILSQLFKTWKLPSVKVHFYPISKYENLVDWVPNMHYSRIYGLLKLALPSALPQSVGRVVVVDTDVLFNADISQLWRSFNRFADKQAIGVVENQSDWYLRGHIGQQRKYLPPWPAIGRGFNTGVMLLDVKKLKALDWNTLWSRVAVETLKMYNFTRLADQDIFNTVLLHHPELLYQLPCEWNIQLSENSDSHKCYFLNEPKVIHWNSPQKTRGRVDDQFRYVHQMFSELNGNLLKAKLAGCSRQPTGQITSKNDRDVCFRFRRAGSRAFRTHIFYWNLKNERVDRGDVTLVVQLSIDRLSMVEKICKLWKGPLSFTIYAADADTQEMAKYIEDYVPADHLANIVFHIVYKDGNLYPINLLRNIGVQNAATDHVLVLDADFLPSPGLHEYLVEFLAEDHSSDKAYVVPAFETSLYKFNLPNSKSELLRMLDAGDVLTFRRDVWPKGHAATNYAKWRNATEPYQIAWEPDFEPYLVVNVRRMPLYDARFVGFGWNKVSYAMELMARGYEFHVLPQAYVVHTVHSPSPEIERFRTSYQYRMCLKKLKMEFIEELQTKYGKQLVDANSVNAS